MTDVSRFYHDVIDDVINGVKDEWVDEGLDLQVLDELKKLWTTKLSETHVFDPEPTTTTAAQYLSLIQRSQIQIRPTTAATVPSAGIALPVRQLNTAGRVVVSSVGPGANTSHVEVSPHGLGVPGSLSALRPSVAQPASHLPQPGVVQSAQHALVHSNLVSNVPGIMTANTGGAQPHTQQPRAVVPTAIQSGGAPQLAALPSGLTGHLVQIGQQTYLVPQNLVGLRQQPGTSQLSISQLVGASGTAVTSTITDPSGFSQTQVDGGHDSDDKFCDTPNSQQPTPGLAGHQPNRLGTGRSAHASDLEDDDDEDDDDFVAATPGFAPASVRSQYPNHPDTGHRDTPTGGTPLISGPPTPMTPQSVASRTPYGGTPGWRRPAVAGHSTGDRHPATPSRKRRRRSPLDATGDTDTEVDDDDEDEYGVSEEVELMTNATMTPAGHGVELEEDDEELLNSVDAKSQRRVKRPTSGQAGPNGAASQPLLSPGSQLGDAVPPPERVGGDSDLLHGEEDEEEDEEGEEPLNSDDDVSDEEPEVLFESDNVIVCQYDKIHRSRNRWRFHLKDGIMAINGRDHVFQKAVGEAEW